MSMNKVLAGFQLLFRRFSADNKGAVAIVYGPMVIVLLLAAGVAIDYSRAYLVKKEISRALDASILAAGSMANADEDTMKAMAERYFDANLSTETKTKYDPQLVFSYNSATAEITASSTAVMDTYLMKLAGHDTVDVAATAVAGRALYDVEVALVLDNTGSMSGSKMSSLKEAATMLVDTLYEPNGSEDFVKFALVPFTGAVNVGTDKLGSGWLDEAGAGQAAQQDFGTSYTYWGISTYDGMTALDALDHFDADWKGCVRARVGTDTNENGDSVSLDVWDIAPDSSDANTLFALHIKPVHLYTNWWGGKPSDNSLRNRLEDVDDECPDAEIVPLTNDQDEINNQINAMNAEGWTNIPTGLMWGWRVLSSAAPFTEGADYGEENVRKVIVVLTDGQNNLGSYYSNKTQGSYSAYGMTAYGNLGTGYPGNALEDKLEDVCANVKSKGILIYSITFQVSDNDTKTLMRNCASREDMYFNSPDGASLQDAFEEIAVGLQKLQLRQ